jgi:nitrite reductase/ring-hydroxylating ferredoxin subunit
MLAAGFRAKEERSMANWVRVADAGDVSDGEVTAYGVGGRQIAVANLGGELRAFDDTCTHQGCSLAEGELDETAIGCPCHGSQFDVVTGEVLEGPATEPVDVFEVREEAGELQVSLE